MRGTGDFPGGVTHSPTADAFEFTLAESVLAELPTYSLADQKHIAAALARIRSEPDLPILSLMPSLLREVGEIRVDGVEALFFFQPEEIPLLFHLSLHSGDGGDGEPFPTPIGHSATLLEWRECKTHSSVISVGGVDLTRLDARLLDHMFVPLSEALDGGLGRLRIGAEIAILDHRVDVSDYRLLIQPPSILPTLRGAAVGKATEDVFVKVEKADLPVASGLDANALLGAVPQIATALAALGLGARHDSGEALTLAARQLVDHAGWALAQMSVAAHPSWGVGTTLYFVHLDGPDVAGKLWLRAVRLNLRRVIKAVPAPNRSAGILQFERDLRGADEADVRVDVLALVHKPDS